MQPGVTPLRGISGGAWTATLTALGHSGAAQRDVWKRWVAACHEQFGGCQGHVRQVAKARGRRHALMGLSAHWGSVQHL